MSTLTGQSFVQPLHARQRSSASITSSDCQPSVMTSPFEHLEQETRAAAGRVHLLARRHEGRAHDVDPAGRAALADADAADGRVREVAVVARVGELDRRPPRLVVGAEAEVLVDAVRLDDLARVHLPVGIPDRLELLERADELVAEHLRQELRARLAVAVLARQRAAELEHEVARVLEPAPELRDPGLRDEVEVPAGVDAALAVVAVERALVAVLAPRASRGGGGTRRAVPAGRPSPPSPRACPPCPG